MAADKASTIWVPVCCGRAMRCNMFRQADGGTYAALVCTQCNKNITLEQEPLAAADTFGGGSSVLSLIASPKPPKNEKKKIVRRSRSRRSNVVALKFSARQKPCLSMIGQTQRLARQ